MNDKKVKLAQILSSDDSNSGAPLLMLQTHGGESLGVMVQPYGLTSLPPNDTFAVVLPINGEESNKMAIAVDLAGRQKNLKPGDAVLENTVTGAFIYLDFNGDINIVAPSRKVNVVADEFNMTVDKFNVVANEINFTAPSFKVNGKNLSDTHTHGGVTPGAGTTGGVS